MITRRQFIQQAALTGTVLASATGCWRVGHSLLRAGVDAAAIQKFQASLIGRLILPSNEAYEIARRVIWSNDPTLDKRPLMIAQCQHVDDVARCIDFARQYQLNVAVRSGGHSFLGWGTCDDGLVIDVSQMKSIVIDPVQGKLRAGAGALAGEMVMAAAKYGLVPVLGQCSTVGAGITLGGGLGWLSAMHGAACDNLISADLLTAGSSSIVADAGSNPDVYWAIRGGGGNFGVVTSLEYRLHPMGNVLAGGFEYPILQAQTVLRIYRDFMAAAPDELQALAYLSSAKNGSLVVAIVYAGDLSAGEKIVDQFRRLTAPIRDWMRPRAYPDTFTMPPYDDADDGSVPCAFHQIKGSYLEQLSDKAIDVVLGRLAEAPAACEVGFDLDHYMHGAVCRVDPGSTAFELRTPGAVHVAFGASWDAPGADATMTWLDRTWDMLQPYSGGRMYANYMSVEGESPAKAAYGASYSRLASIKNKYDPDNFFRRNLNIGPL